MGPVAKAEGTDVMCIRIVFHLWVSREAGLVCCWFEAGMD